MRSRCVVAALSAVCVVASIPAKAAGVCRNPDALGTARVLAVDPAEHRQIGAMQYAETLPLADHEVVLTFDDGPLPPHTRHVLEALADECVQATFFMVGSMAHDYPDWVRRVYDAGHTVGSHSHSHPRAFGNLDHAVGTAEIDRGIAEVSEALGASRAIAPFYRFPGFRRSAAYEAYLESRGLMTWGADIPADDWKHIGVEQVIDRALTRLQHRGRGVLLLHDIQSVTARALPRLLRELKARGFKIVHVVPAGPQHPKTITTAAAWASNRRHPKPVPPATPVPTAAVTVAASLPAPSAMSFGFPQPFATRISIASADGASVPFVVDGEDLTPSRLDGRMRENPDWPHLAEPPLPELTVAAALPAPAARRLDFEYRLRPSLVAHAAAAATQTDVAAEPAAAAEPAQTEPVTRRPATREHAPSERAPPWSRMMNWIH